MQAIVDTILAQCSDEDRIRIAMAILPPGFEVVRPLPDETFKKLLAGARDGSVDWRDPDAIPRALRDGGET